MKSTKLLLMGLFSMMIGLGAQAQIFNATQPILGIWGAPNNTGLAISPNFDIQTAVYDDGSGFYQVNVIEGSAVVDVEVNFGDDPDVAYFGDASTFVVSYEAGGDIYVDEYNLNSLFPADYSISSMTNIAPGTYSNIDVNSMGEGVLTWEDGGDIWACSFSFPGFSQGPPVPITSGSQPDIVLLDDNQTVALTYIDPNGSLHIYTMDYADLTVGAFSPMQLHGYDWLGNTAKFPRIAAQRHANFGPAEDFTVVAQYQNTANAEVYGVFSTGGTISGSPVLVNAMFSGSCPSSDPRPVVAYDRSEVHVAWSQDYQGACSGLWQSNPNFENDVVLANFDPNGNLLTSSASGIPPSTFIVEEVNSHQSFYAGNSRTSISTEYDGFYSINNFNYEEGLLFSDPGDLLWKERRFFNPTFMNDQIAGERGNNFSLVTSPVNQSIEVLSESDDAASFQLLDNAGRVVELRDILNNDNAYSIDISHLSGGLYFLHCSSNSGEEVLRVLQVSK